MTVIANKAIGTRNTFTHPRKESKHVITSIIIIARLKHRKVNRSTVVKRFWYLTTNSLSKFDARNRANNAIESTDSAWGPSKAAPKFRIDQAKVYGRAHFQYLPRPRKITALFSPAFPSSPPTSICKGNLRAARSAGRSRTRRRIPATYAPAYRLRKSADAHGRRVLLEKSLTR